MSNPETPPHFPPHFKGQDAIKHVTENYAKGIIASSEIHGTEIPGAISALTDAAKESALIFLLLLTLFLHIKLPVKEIYLLLLSFSLGWIIFKTGRSAHLGWSRLERLNRIAAQEKWEIDHNREQEREELTALYEAKGFQGKLLEDVMDVLMSDQDLLLRVMLEEELGLSLEVHEHPLKQAFGAFLGSFLTLLTLGLFFYFFGFLPTLILSFLTVALAAFISAKFEHNEPLPSLVWNLGIMTLSFGSLYFLIQFLYR